MLPRSDSASRVPFPRFTDRLLFVLPIFPFPAFRIMFAAVIAAFHPAARFAIRSAVMDTMESLPVLTFH